MIGIRALKIARYSSPSLFSRQTLFHPEMASKREMEKMMEENVRIN
jgi:hypothetical protein